MEEPENEVEDGEESDMKDEEVAGDSHMADSEAADAAADDAQPQQKRSSRRESFRKVDHEGSDVKDKKALANGTSGAQDKDGNTEMKDVNGVPAKGTESSEAEPTGRVTRLVTVFKLEAKNPKRAVTKLQQSPESGTPGNKNAAEDSKPD